MTMSSPGQQSVGPTDQMRCREVVQLVTDYLEGALSATDHVRFEDHLVLCPNCVIYIDQMRITIEALGRLDEEELSDEARAALLDAFRDWERAR